MQGANQLPVLGIAGARHSAGIDNAEIGFLVLGDDLTALRRQLLLQSLTLSVIESAAKGVQGNSGCHNRRLLEWKNQGRKWATKTG